MGTTTTCQCGVCQMLATARPPRLHSHKTWREYKACKMAGCVPPAPAPRALPPGRAAA